VASDPAALARAAIDASIAAQQALLEDESVATLVRTAELLSGALRAGGKLLFFGNGGSATDATHLAAEFVGRFERERRGYPALSLAANQSAVTAIANDYGFERVFARQIEALGSPEDVAVALSTSGGSANVLAGVTAARSIGMATVGLTGAAGDALAQAVDVCLRASSSVTARVQESHILMGHVLCELVERTLQ
jgi:D-sedoheptulose 7-phosphate isomerase